MFASYQTVNLRSRACSSCLPPPCGRVLLGHSTLFILPCSSFPVNFTDILIALLSEFGERVCGPMFVHVYISLAFEMRWPSVPTELAVVLTAFPHFASPLAIRQVDITTVTCLNTDDTVNTTCLASYCSHHAADFLQGSCTGAVRATTGAQGSWPCCDAGLCMGTEPSTPRQGSLAELELDINLTSSCCFCPEPLWLRAQICLSSQAEIAEASLRRAKVP